MKKIFYLIVMIIFTSTVFADLNGVWNRAEDIQLGVFGSDEESYDTEISYGFNNPVMFSKHISFFDEVYFNSSVLANCNGKLHTVNGKIICGAITWSEISSIPSGFQSNPPICSGTGKALQWTGSSWVCVTIEATTPIPTPTPSPSCTANAYSSCSGGNVYWYNSCNIIGSLKESCSNGCTGSSCNTILAWYVKYPGVYKATVPNTINQVSLSVSSTGVVSGTYIEHAYLYSGCFYPYMTSNKFLYSATTPGCPGDGTWHDRSELSGIPGVTEIKNTFSLTATMNVNGAYSGSWTQVGTGGTGTFSGQGSSTGTSLILNGFAYGGKAFPTMTLIK